MTAMAGRGLPLLVKLSQRHVDEHRAELGRIGHARADAEAALAAHDTTADDEATRAAADAAALAAFAAWARHAARNRSRLKLRCDELDRTEAAAREALREVIAQAKRLEIALETTEDAARRVAGQREYARADETELLRPRRERFAA